MTCTTFLERVVCLNKVTARVGQQPRKSYVIAVDEAPAMLAGTKLRCPLLQAFLESHKKKSGTSSSSPSTPCLG